MFLVVVDGMAVATIDWPFSGFVASGTGGHSGRLSGALKPYTIILGEVPSCFDVGTAVVSSRQGSEGDIGGWRRGEGTGVLRWSRARNWSVQKEWFVL